MTINVLAKALVMDRTTLGRNVLPLEREGLIDIMPYESLGPDDYEVAVAAHR